MISLPSHQIGEPPRSRTAKRREPILLALGVFVAYSLMSLLVLSTHDWDPKAFILERPQDIPDTQTWGVGYDGRFAYALALEPVGADEGEVLDKPAYRYMRIVYPIAARILGLGIPELIPWSLLALNILVAGATAWLLADLAGVRAGAVWVVLILLLSLNYLIGIRLDLNEPLATLLSISGLWFHKRRRPALAAAAFALAGLTKEVFLTFPMAVAIYEITRRNFKVAAILLVGSTLPYLAWSAAITQWIGTSPFSYSLSKPSLVLFAGIRRLQPIEAQIIVTIWAIGPAIVAALAVAWKSVREWPQRPSLMAWLILVNVALLVTLPVESWADPLAILRLALGALVAGLLWLSQVKPRLLPYVAAIWIPSLLIAFLLPGLLI
ncbi:MAG: hypothetical protein IH953_01205 [Chloroflexi bacterium]|nr:hypothetical protein [Chloroflexota bacterium]